MIKPIFDTVAAKAKLDEISWDFGYKMTEQMEATNASLDRIAERVNITPNHVNEKRGFEFPS